MVESGKKSSAAQTKARKFFPSRVVIEHVYPEIDGGEFPLGETVHGSAGVHGDEHNAPTAAAGLGLCSAEVDVQQIGTDEHKLKARIDKFGDWRHGTAKKIAAGQGRADFNYFA